ncbi:MAG: hypothetical protein ABI888_05240 [Chloroflexota bacterium]
MLQAVHSDRSGRIFVSADYGATALDGDTPVTLDRAVPLPSDAQLLPLADRAAVGIDRRGLPRPLGPARWALAAVLPSGFLRTHVPAADHAADAASLEPLPYAAVAADATGEIVVAAIPLGPTRSAAPSMDDLASRITERLRSEPSNRLLRQLARCAREYACPAARNAFLGQGECALPLGAPASDQAGPLVALRRREERAPLEPSAMPVNAADAAAVANAHFAAGGTSVSFGHACEGDPLGLVRVVADAATLIARQAGHEVILRTSGSSAPAIARAADAGVDRIIVPLASAHGPTYERVHAPVGLRWTDVRGGLREAASRKLALTIELLSLPGLTDREAEAQVLLALLGELPAGTVLTPIDLAADPYGLLARLPKDSATIGIAALLERVRTDAAHVRLAA